MQSAHKLVVLLVLSGISVAMPAKAETYATCTGFIDSVPTTISTQGVWCMRHDLSTGVTFGEAVEVATNNVTIDCNGFKLGGLAAGIGTATIGIHSGSRLNTTVRNCNIRGFLYGLSFDGAGGGHTVEDNRFDGNTYVGIQVMGDGSVVRRNRVFDTGGSTVQAGAFGMYTVNSVDVLDNILSAAFARAGSGGTVFGIITASNTGGSVVGNRIRGLVPDGAGDAIGISNSTAGRFTLRDNDLVGDGDGGSIGMSCSSASVRAKDNVVNGFATPLLGCSNDGGNVLVP